MAAHSGGTAGDIAYQTSTGFLYTQRGAIDPATNALVGRFPLPPGGAPVISQVANVRTGINYGRTGTTPSTLTAFDARPDSATLHQFLPMPAVSPATDTVLGIAIDTAHGRLYAAHGPSITNALTQTTVSVIDIVPGSPTFHQVIKTVSLGNGVRAQSVAVNSHTRNVYVATSGSAGSPGVSGGVFVFDDTLAAPTATKNANTTGGTWGVVINEAANLVFATTATGGTTAAVYAIDGATNAVALINLGVPFRFGSPDERMAVHQASGKVLVRMESTVSIIDGQRGSPSRNTVVATLNVGRENGQTDIAIDEATGRAITVGNYAFQADVIDLNLNGLAGTIPLSTYGQDVAIDPIHHRAFVSVFTYVQIVDLVTMQSIAGPPVFIESGGIVLNPVTNKAYAGLFTTQADVLVMAAAGIEGSLAGVQHRGRYLSGEWHNHTNRAFIVDQGDSNGVTSEPGSVLVIDGTNDTVLGTVDVLPGPFGLGIDQNADKVYVASLSAPFTHGGLTIVDPNNGDTTSATFSASPSAVYPAFPLNNQGALLGFGRQVVVNPVTGKVYTMQLSGGSASTGAVYNPQTNLLSPLDGIAGSPLFDAANPGACGGASPQPACVSWGRVNVIRVAPSLNRVYLGLLDNNNVGRVVALDATTNAVIGSWVGGSHSNRHSASFIVVNESQHVLYVTDYTNNKVTKLDAATLSPIGSPTSLPGGPSATAFNATANRLYVSAIDGKTIYAIDGNTMAVISSVKMPLSAYFMWVDEVESRIYASGGDNADESGAMVITDVLGQLGTNVTVTSAGSAQHGITHLNSDGSITYTPDLGYAGPDSFSYNIAAPTGTAVGTVSINVVPSTAAVVAFGDGYSTNLNALLTVAAPGPLANDATGSSSTTMAVDDSTDHGVLTPQPNGAFTYQPDAGFTGVDSFVYHAVTDSDGSTNTATVTITVGSGTSLVVTNTNDSGAGSLRQAISTANIEPGSTISFNIPGAGPFTISPASALPTISAPVTIDGYTQPGASPNTAAVGTNAVIKIALNGSSISGTFDGLQIVAGSSTVRGLAIGGFKDAGIFLGTAGGNTIEGNFLGTDASGNAAVPNGLVTVTQNGTTASGAAVISRSPNNLIGGSSAASRNLISGNYSQGVRVDSQDGSPANGAGTTIVNNLIGTNASGNAALANGLAPNGGSGISVLVPNVTIGGPSAALRNVISGNNGQGISASPSTFGSPQTVVTVPNNLMVQGNYIGVKADGSGPLGNTTNGLFVVGPNTHIGGANATPGFACSGACNVIAGNGGLGLIVSSSTDIAAQAVTSSGAGSFVEGNYIGINPTGVTAMPNAAGGMSITAPGVTIGGTTAGQRNVISGNSNNGITLNAIPYSPTTTVATSGTGAIITGNFIGLNAAGTGAVPNAGSGIAVLVPNVRIGGPTANERNVVSGNGGVGISGGASVISSGGTLTAISDSTNLTVIGNYVGVSADASTARPNNNGGVFVSAPNAKIGGTTNATIGACTGACNLISGNNGSGVSVGANYENNNAATLGQIYSQGTGAQIVGNFIGVTLGGNTAMPNGNAGIQVNAANAVIGGSTAIERNVISGNGTNGINIANNFVTSTNATVTRGDGATIRGNYIGLGADGVTKVTNASISSGSFAVIIQARNVMFGGPNSGDLNYVVPGGGRAISVQRHLNGAAVISTGDTNTVQGNTVGLNAGGARMNGGGNGAAVQVESANNQIRDNVVAGNGASGLTNVSGITLFSAFATGNTVAGNFVGTDRSGTAGLGNTQRGIAIQDASNNTIGGTNAADRNIVVSNGNFGISFDGTSAASSGNVVQGNYVGVKADGTTPMGNTGVGINLFANSGSTISGNTIGGSVPGARNVIAGNSGDGISLGGGTAGNVNTNSFAGNLIGIGADGVSAVANGGHGVFINNAADNTFGGSLPADGNIIANNGGRGVVIQSQGLRNRILSNLIFSNGDLGIDLGFDGVTPNDTGDADTGANNKQNYPVIAGGSFTPSASELQGTLDSTPNTVFTLQLFRSATCDASGYGEGKELRDTQTIVTGPTGLGYWTLTTAGPGGSSYSYSVTATDPNGNTSEFSACYPAPPSTIVSNTNASGPGSLANAITTANSLSPGQTITFNIPGASAGSPAVISLGGVALPVIAKAVTIDATTQPGWDGKPVIELTGNNNVANGFETAPDVAGVTIKGIAITRFSNAGVMFLQADGGQTTGNTVQQSYIGTNRFDVAGSGNNRGIILRTDYSSITGNVISGNSLGVVLEVDANNVVIQGNTIGLTGDGNSALSNFGSGIVMYDSVHNVIVDTNTISANQGPGIDLQDTAQGDVTNVNIRHNTIGLNVSGSASYPNAGGIQVNHANGTIIGDPSGRNTISGNTGYGIHVMNAVGTLTKIQNNFIGLDLNGINAKGNNNKGIVLDAPANVGGANAGEGNYISGNGQGDPAGAGIMLSPGADNSSVLGNIIGLNTQNNIVGNGYSGLTVRSSGYVQIGGPGNGANVISGNGQYGISIVKVLPGDSLPANVFINYNKIGTDPSGTQPRANGAGGINVNDGVGIHIGGNSGSGNIIALNMGPAVRVMPNAFTVRIQENSMFANLIGIDLGGDGHTANDASGHSGANSYQNYTPLVSALNSSGSTQISYDTNALQVGQFTVEFFLSPACNTSGYGEGKQFIGSQVVNGGSGTLNFQVPAQPAGSVITATATDATNNTSEFSNCVVVAASGPPVNGTVRYSGTPLSGVTVKLTQGSPTSMPLQTTTSDGSGFYQFNNVPNGAYFVRVDGPDANYVPWVAMGINVSGSNVNQDMQLPKLITLAVPAYGASNVSARPLLTWSGITEAARYVIQINRTSDWLQVEAGAQSTDNSYQVVQALDANTNYTWQVHAYDSNNREVGASVNQFNFTTGTGTVWMASGSGSTTVTDNGISYSPGMSYQNNGPYNFTGDWTFNTVAASAGNIGLDYNWTGFHSFFQATAAMEVFVNRGGVDVFTSQLVNAGPEDCPPCTPPSNGFTYTGSTAVTVQPGDTYGFRLHGSHYDGTYVLQGTLNLTVRP
jgi:parallel beta-helix repeat protein